MKVSVILAHPNKQSFNHAIAIVAIDELKKNDHTVVFHDLYVEHFDPILPKEEILQGASLPQEIDMHCQELTSSNGIIIHPNWWGQPPAILKGWVDRVLRPGIAYQPLQGAETPIGLLESKVVIVFNTADTPAERENVLFGDPLETLWKNSIFGFCGVKTFYREMFRVISTSTANERVEWLTRVRRSVAKYLPKVTAQAGVDNVQIKPEQTTIG